MPSPDILRLTTTEDGRFRLEIDIVVNDLGQAMRLLQEIDAERRISPGEPLTARPPRRYLTRVKPGAHPLRRYRARHNMTLKDLAALLSCGAPSISKIETRKQAPSSSMLRKILEQTQGELTAEELLGPKT